MVASYNGWQASPDPKAIGINTEWEPIPGHRFPGGVKAGDVETVLTWVVRQLDAKVEPIDRDAIKDEWGYAYKPSANSPDTLSCHSSGTAFDYNATRHPNGHRGTFTDAQVRGIRSILAEVGVVRWLGDATRTADEMHFEIHGTAAQVASAARRIRQSHQTPQEDDDVKPRIVWFTKGTDTHAYQLYGSGIACHLTQSGLDLARYLEVEEVKGKLGTQWQDGVAIMDGPCRNVPS